MSRSIRRVYSKTPLFTSPSILTRSRRRIKAAKTILEAPPARDLRSVDSIGRYLVFLDWEVRAEIHGVHVYRDQHGKVLLYFINCMLPERVVANNAVNSFHNAGYSSSATQYILVDLGMDGKFESQYTEATEFWNDVTKRGVPGYFHTDHSEAKNSVVYNLLQIKLAGKKIEIPCQSN